jgi:hypothetical protein
MLHGVKEDKDFVLKPGLPDERNPPIFLSFTPIEVSNFFSVRSAAR